MPSEQRADGLAPGEQLFPLVIVAEPVDALVHAIEGDPRRYASRASIGAQAAFCEILRLPLSGSIRSRVAFSGLGSMQALQVEPTLTCQRTVGPKVSVRLGCCPPSGGCAIT